MHLAAFALIIESAMSLAPGTEARDVPSLPDSWPTDLRERIEPTLDCPGGTPESLRKRVGLSDGFASPEEFGAITKEDLPMLEGVLPNDTFHQVRFRAELPDGTFWGFGGFVVVRAGCVIHAEITSYDN